MANIKDVYEILSRANTSGIDKATSAVKKHGDAVEKAGRQADKSSGLFGKLKGVVGGLMRVLVGLAIGGIMKLGGAFAWLGEKLFGGSEALSGLGKVADKITKGPLKKLGQGLSAAGNLARKTFGAIGKVGAGFVQRAASTTKSALTGVAKGIGVFGLALGALAAAAPLLGDIGGLIERLSPRASKAFDRIGAALGKVRDIFLGAILEAMVPYLEMLADAMEDPRFIAFVQMLADKLAGAIVAVADFLVNTLIPALVKLWNESEPVRKAIEEKLGQVFQWLADEVLPVLGSVLQNTWFFIKDVIVRVGVLVYNFVKSNWKNISRVFKTAMKLLERIVDTGADLIRGIVEVLLLVIEGKWDSAWKKVQNIVDSAWEGIKGIIGAAIDVIDGLLGFLSEALGRPWEGIETIVEEVWDGLKALVERGVNWIIDLINKLIGTYNDTIAKLPGASPIEELEPVHLASGGIVRSPVAAVVGDNPRSPEVVAPLHELIGILRSTFGSGGLGGTTIQVSVSVAPGGFATPEEAGRRVAQSMVEEARRRGMRLGS